MKKTQFDTAIFYTCGVCNLQCRYCGIDKNPILAKIDQALEDSFKDSDYYFNQLKKYFPNRGQLKRIETWGGEPFLRMDRIYPLLHQVINHYPYFSEMFSSTNFSYDSWTNQFFGLMKQFSLYPHRQFKYHLQLSIDGPEYINDNNRGLGVTQKCLNNFNKFINRIKNGDLPENVELVIALKATLDNDNLYHLNNKQALIEYFQFFEINFDEIIHNANLGENVLFCSAHPNTAVPAPTTKKDGQIFANICKLCKEIETENVQKNYFKYYTRIMLFDNSLTQNALTYKYSCHTCGTGTSMLGFMPDNMLSTCHEGFTHFIEEYKKLAASSNRDDTATITFDKFLSEQTLPFCVKENGYEEHCKKMSYYEIEGTSARLVNLVTQIISLAMAEQIEPQFIEYENALKAAIFLQSHTAYCIKDNYNKTGSFTTVPNGLIKLLLNGAMQYIQHDGELSVEKGDTCYGCQYCS